MGAVGKRFEVQERGGKVFERQGEGGEIAEMATITKETIEIKAGELNLNAPYTSEGLRAIRAMVTFLEAELMEEEKIKSKGGVSPKSEAGSEKTGKMSEDKTTSPFSPPLSSPKQRIKFKNWEAIATAKSGILYKEVVDRFLIEYKDSVEPSIEKLSQIIREMYGKELKDTSIATYVSVYKRYIRENKLCQSIIPPQPKEVLIHPFKKLNDYKTSINLRKISIEKVAEIWNVLPDKFTYKQVKALIPAGTMQSEARIDATNFTIREFKENPAFECEESSPGEFEKKLVEKGEGEE